MILKLWEINEKRVIRPVYTTRVNSIYSATHHFTMIRVVSLIDQRKVVLPKAALKSQKVREHPRFILQEQVRLINPDFASKSVSAENTSCRIDIHT